MGFAAPVKRYKLCRLKNIYRSAYRYRQYHSATCLRNINEIYSASAILFNFSYGAKLTQNISKAGAFALAEI
jgi:hypothetical protein